MSDVLVILTCMQTDETGAVEVVNVAEVEVTEVLAQA